MLKLAALKDAEELRDWNEYRPEIVPVYTRAISGDSAAMGEMGAVYLDGIHGLPRNDSEALRWSGAGAAAGDGLWMCNIDCFNAVALQ